MIGIGDNVVDKYFHLKKIFPGGNALNFSVYAKQMGVSSAYMGVFGDDEAARHIISVMNKFNIDISHCRQYHGENGCAGVNIVDGERVFGGGNKGGIAARKAMNITEKDLEYIAGFNLIHSSCYSFLENELSKFSKIDRSIVSLFLVL